MTTSPQAVPRQLPSSVLVSAILTWLLAGPTLMVLIFLIYVAAPIIEAFAGEAQGEIMAFLVVALVLCVAACVTAVFLLMGRAWAHWALVALSAVSVAGSLVAATLLLPLIITVGSVTVVVLLMGRDARDWFHDRPVG